MSATISRDQTTARETRLDESLARKLLGEYGSPLYVYNAEVLGETIRKISNSFDYPETRFCFASVTNGNTSLLRIFRKHGWGLHANTPGDVFLALHAGFAPSEIVYSGSNLNRDEMIEMLDRKIGIVNLDSVPQLETMCELLVSDFAKLHRPRLGLRLNLPEITGETRIGVSPAELSEAVAITKSAGLKLSGIHFYRGTATNSTSAFVDSIETVIEIGATLPDWEYLDFGGGFGYPYRTRSSGFEWERFGTELSKRMRMLSRPVELIIEPGRSVIAGSGTLLTRVVSAKWQGEKQIVGVDTSVANIAVLSVHGGYRDVHAMRKDSAEQFITDVCGNTTFSRDYLGRNCLLPRMEIDDVLAILDVGAYGYAMSSHFLHRPRPAEVLFENGTHRLIRRREDYDVLIGQQV